MKEELKNGHQIYVVTPLIDESETIDTANANEVYNKMVKYFEGQYNVGIIPLWTTDRQCNHYRYDRTSLDQDIVFPAYRIIEC
jgi:hypothetical protein